MSKPRDCEAVRLVMIDVRVSWRQMTSMWWISASDCMMRRFAADNPSMLSRTYGLKAQVGIIGGVLTGFVTGIHKDSVRRWNLWFPSTGVFTDVFAGRATGTQITLVLWRQTDTFNTIHSTHHRSSTGSGDHFPVGVTQCCLTHSRTFYFKDYSLLGLLTLLVY